MEAYVTRFKAGKDIVKKITWPNGKEDLIASLECTEKKEPFIGGDFLRTYNSCIEIRSMGSKHISYFSCNEYHYAITGEWVVTFECARRGEFLHFEKNGNFIMSSATSNLSDRPTDDYKDSLSLSVGKCADIDD